MKVKVNEKCIGCGSCVSLTDGNIFDFDDETGQACCIVDNIENSDVELVKQCMEYCPVGAIEENEE